MPAARAWIPPASSPARQDVAVAQVTDSRPEVLSDVGVDQVPEYVVAPPAASTATQNVVAAHDTAVSGAVSTGVGADHVPV